MAAIRHLLTVPLAISSFVGVFYAIGKLMVFLSLPSKIPMHHIWVVNLLDDWSRLEITLLPLTIDAILIVLFILSHSFLKSEIVKLLWNKLGLSTATRSIYNLVTAAAIIVLVEKWERVPSVTIWNFNTDTTAIYWFYIAVHATAWIIIYGGTVVMDLPELTGVKQVYYDWNNLFQPSNYKSQQLNQLYVRHVRHPSFFGFSIILWFPNIMSLDRLLLAVLWTAYMFIAWRTDDQDVAYQREQLHRKRAELLK